MQLLATRKDVDTDAATLGIRFDAVVDGIFQQRLQQEGGQQGAGRGVVGAPVDAQALTQAQGFQVQIGACQFHLAAQG